MAIHTLAERVRRSLAEEDSAAVADRLLHTTDAALRAEYYRQLSELLYRSDKAPLPAETFDAVFGVDEQMPPQLETVPMTARKRVQVFRLDP